MSHPILSIVIPALNEKENIFPLLQRLNRVISKFPFLTETIIVDDGSTDGTADEVMRAHAQDTRIGLIKLSRNFGHQVAILAGLDIAQGDAVIVMDADLQHPPEMVEELVQQWQAGADIVQTIRKEAASAGLFKRWSSKFFYWLIRKMTAVPIIPGAADFFLINRKALMVFLQCREYSRFNRGLLAWIGFRRVFVDYDCADRHAGESKYTLKKMLLFAMNAIFAFSVLPLRLGGLAGLLLVFFSILYLFYVIGSRLFTEAAIPGWASVIGLITLFGGFQLIISWIMGEYVARIAEQTRMRPHYAINVKVEPSFSSKTNIE